MKKKLPLTPEEERWVEGLIQRTEWTIWSSVALVGIALLMIYNPVWLQDLLAEPAPTVAQVELKPGDLDPIYGLVVDENYELVGAVCGGCHSTKLVTQNRATREGWKELIVWMQETQKLADLGKNEPIILDYLAKHYSPKKKGRRANLADIEWYELE